MIIKPYKYRDKIADSVTRYYRVVLNNNDKQLLYASDQDIFQLKCISALPIMLNLGRELDAEILEFSDRIIPNSKSQVNTLEFCLLFTHKVKRNYLVAIQIDFKNDAKIKIRDMYIYNTCSPLKRQNSYPFPEPEYLFLSDIDKVLKRIFELPMKVKLCKNCKFYPEYQQKGYCLKYHPETNLPLLNPSKGFSRNCNMDL